MITRTHRSMLLALAAACAPSLSACANEGEAVTQTVRMQGDRPGDAVSVTLERDVNGREWVPLREAIQVFGFRYEWDSVDKAALLGYTDPIFKLYAGRQEAWAGRPIELRSPPLRLDGETPMVALDTLTELLDANVQWNKNHTALRVGLPEDELASPSLRAAAAGAAVRATGAGSFRTGPSVQDRVIRYLKIGEPVELLTKVNQYWYQIRDAGGVTGYTSSRYIPESAEAAPAPAVPVEPAPAPAPAPSPAQPAGGQAQQVLAYSRTLLGTKYQFGAGPYEQARAFDCSSFVQHVFRRYDVELPRSSRQQSNVGRSVARDELQPGDLVFFYTPGRFNSNKIVGHVAIYQGNGQIIHTYGKPGVVVTDLNAPSWSKRYLFSRRVLQ